MSAYDYVQQAFGLVQQSWDLAESKANLLDTKLAAATTAATADFSLTGSSVSTDVSVAEPTNPTPAVAPTMTGSSLSTDVAVSEPSVLIPYEATGPDLTYYNSLVNDAIDKLSTLFGGYMAEYFPVDNATNAAAEQVIQAMLAGGTGVDATVEAQLWERDRSRINEEALQAQDAVVAQFAAKGFPIPPGAAAHAVMLIQQKAQDELSKSSREVAIKMFDTEIQQIRFAIESSTKLRQVALSTAGEYIKALASSLTVGQQLAISKSDIQNRLISAAADFYRARQSAKELVLKKDTTNASMAMEASKGNLSANLETTKTNVQALSAMAPMLQARVSAKELELKKDATNAGFTMEASKENLRSDLAVLDEKVKVALAAADSVSRMAAAALNNLHASASAGVNSSSGTSVGYNYSNDTQGAAPSMISVF